MSIFRKKKKQVQADDSYFSDELSAADKLYYILNIGNHEFSKNRGYILDEIVFRLESGHPVKNIAAYIYNFVYKTWDIKISKRKLTRWIKETYKFKIESIKNKNGFRKR